MLAAKAAYAASLLEGDQGQDVVVAAAHSDTASIRVAAAAAAGNLPTESASTVLMDLVGDTDAGVRKVALSAVPDDAPPELTDKVNTLSRNGTDERTARSTAGRGPNRDGDARRAAGARTDARRETRFSGWGPAGQRPDAR